MALIQVPQLRKTDPYAGLGQMLVNVWDMYKGIKAGQQKKEDEGFANVTSAVDTTNATSKFPPVEDPVPPSLVPSVKPPENLYDILKSLGIGTGGVPTMPFTPRF